ncbi:MAG: sugar phosphate isomerase/epimerase family protein [Actinomycetota bacterium]
MPLAEAAKVFADLSVTDIELSVDTGFALVQLDDLLDADSCRAVKALLDEVPITVSALSNHRDGQLVLGPHHEVTNGFFRGTAEEKRTFGIRRMKDTARAADALGVRIVTGFTGCPDYSRWFHWPGERGWEVNLEAMQEVWSGILAVYDEYGVAFAHELHPKQVVYESWTARESIEMFRDFKSWGLNLDTGNLVLAGVDPVSFIREFGAHVLYVHAKDVEHARPTTREHFIARPKYGDIMRNFRFRVPGWGELNWPSILTELHLIGYTGVVAVEHEDPTMGRVEGARRGLQFLGPLLLETSRERRWW